MPDTTPPPAAALSDRFAFSVTEAAILAAVGRSTVYESIKAGGLKARKAGRRTLILRDDLQAWLHGFPLVKAA